MSSSDVQKYFAQCAEKGQVDNLTHMLKKYAKKLDLNHKEMGFTALMTAAKNGHLAVVQLLVEKGANLDIKSANGAWTALMRAASSGQLAIVQYLAEKGANLDMQDEYGYTSLIKAAERGYLPIVQYLTEKGANKDIQDNSGCTALLKASSFGHLPIVQYLFENHANIFVQDKMGDSALLLCLSQGHFSAAQYLLQQFDVSNTSTAASSSSSPKSAFSIPSALARSMSSSFLDLSNKYGDTALMICAEKGHYDLVNFLLRQQVNVNAGNTYGYTALMKASKNGHNMVVQLLVDYGANIDTQNKVGSTALMKAAQYGHLSIVQYLFQQSANMNLQDKEGGTALLYALEANQLIIIDYLIAQGARIQDSHGLALRKASQKGYFNIVRHLVEQYTNPNNHPNHPNYNGNNGNASKSLSHVQHLIKQYEEVQLLQSPNSQSPRSNSEDLMKLENVEETTSALSHLSLTHPQSLSSFATTTGTSLSTSSSSSFLFPTPNIPSSSAEAYVNIQDSEGYTALMFAAEHNHLCIVQYLLEHGPADLNLFDKQGSNVLMKVCYYGHIDVLEYLLEHWRFALHLNQQDLFAGSTALMKACYNGHIDVVSALLQISNSNNSSMVAVAGEQKQPQDGTISATEDASSVVVLEPLNIDVQSKDGYTAIMKASCKGHIEIVGLLGSHGANLSIVNKKGKNVKDVAHYTIKDAVDNLLIQDKRKRQILAVSSPNFLTYSQSNVHTSPSGQGTTTQNTNSAFSTPSRSNPNSNSASKMPPSTPLRSASPSPSNRYRSPSRGSGLTSHVQNVAATNATRAAAGQSSPSRRAASPSRSTPTTISAPSSAKTKPSTTSTTSTTNSNANSSPSRRRGSGTAPASSSTAAAKKTVQESTPTSLLAKSLPVQKHGVSAILYLCYLSWQNNTFTQKILQAKQMRSVGFYREFLTERQRFEDSHKEWLSLLLLPELTPNSPTSTTNSSASKTTSSANKSGASAPFTPLKRSNSLIVSPTSSSRTTTPSFATSSSRNTPIHSSNNAIANLQTEIRNSTFFKINKNDLRSQITWIFQQIEKEIEIAWNRQQGSDEALVDIEKIEKMERFKEQLQRESEQMEDLLQAFSKSSEPSDSKSTAVVDEKGVAIQQNDDLPLAVNKKGTDEEAGEYLHPSEHPALLLCEQDMDISFHEIS